MKPSVLVVDDEPSIRELLTMTLSRMKLDCQAAESTQAARDLLAEHRFDLCLTDMRLPDGNGIDLVRHIQERQPELPVAIITAYGSMDTAVEALKAGAFDFISKPVQLDNLRNMVRTALKLRESKPTPPGEPDTRLLGTAPVIQQLRVFVNKVSTKDAPVHIQGESGTGKELIARLIHDSGPRREGPFVPVNCGAIPSELMESELFGHKKGSFTGAVADKTGLFEAANGGTLFLDEIGDLPLVMQVKLLRVLQERAVRPVGGTREVPIDVRIISATNQRLDEMVQDDRFRQDLYYRIVVLQIHTPSLREHPEDIPALAEAILSRLSPGDPPTLDRGAHDALRAYPFPGNVRELENVLERALALHEGGSITTGDLMIADRGTDKSSQPQREPGESLNDYVERIEAVAIEEALRATGNNKTAAAKKLGISFRSLRYKLEKLGID